MRTFFRLNVYAGLGALILSVTLLIFQIPFMKTWFYICAWWPLILLLDGLNFRFTGSSPLSHSPKNFMFAAFISVPVWLIFEIFNLRLQNWSYHSLPSEYPLRWLGYFLAFASVIPALQELSTLFQHILKTKKITFFHLKATPVLLTGCVMLGFFFLALPVIFPHLFFPLVWLGFIFLLEPANYRLKNSSLLMDLEKRQGNRIISWLLSGLTAGILWESLNFWAGSHWQYSLPYLNVCKIFQMPVLGYGGFSPFALEVFTLYALLDFMRKKVQRKRVLKTGLVILVIGFDILVFHFMDMYTRIP